MANHTRPERVVTSVSLPRRVWLKASTNECASLLDVRDLEEHLRSEQIEAAVALYQGEFLHGFYVRGTRLFDAWASSSLPSGQPLCQPEPLFKKLDESVIDEEYERLGE